MLKSILPPRLFASLRRLRDLSRRLRQELHLNRPKAKREAALQEVEALDSRPTISLAMPTYKSDLGYLAKAIDSVRAQHYREWELCIVDDGSEQPELVAVLQRYADADRRIKFEAAENRGISGATNAAMAMSSVSSTTTTS
jgi:cellulose synthase/poly-beta-1,6-N-acetylglucosamine synthase-like glycosyltransferase